MTRLDDLRQEYPDLGFAIYAIEPGGVVTFEVYAPDGQVYSFAASSAAAAVDSAFPPPAVLVQPEPTPAAKPAVTSSVFD